MRQAFEKAGNFIDLPDQRAWVVFSGQTDLPWLNLLKEGYRHCFVLLNDGRRWITIDPLANYTDIRVHDISSDFDLPRWLQIRGDRILPARIRRKDKQAPCMPFSCVEVVKRVLGIHAKWIVTPWQLYRFLEKEQTARIFQTHQNKGDFVWEA